MLTRHRRSKCDMTDETSLPFRVLPTDIDVNKHMTNSRYFSFMDLSRVDHLVRCGAWKKVRAKKLMPSLGSGSIRFRRAVPPFKKVDVTTRMIGVDEKWICLEHKIVSGDTMYSVAILKAAFLNTGGRILVSELLSILVHEGEPPPMTEALGPRPHTRRRRCGY
jgi:acyl-CoA thioesterase FadM